MHERLKAYIDKMEKIRDEQMISKTELCRILETTYPTLEKVYNGDSIAFKTMKKVKNFVDSYEQRKQDKGSSD
jgi:predicted transcriptional regulator